MGMALRDCDFSLFEETRVSPDFSEDHGVFYQGHSELGHLAQQLRGESLLTQNLDRVKDLSATDPRLRSLLEPCQATFSFILGPDKNNFYSMTAQDEPYPTAAVFVWPPGTELEFSYGSHTGQATGTRASNLMVHRPYINLSETRKLRDLPIKMVEGGMYVSS